MLSIDIFHYVHISVDILAIAVIISVNYAVVEQK